MVGITDVLGVETNTDACATAEAAGHRRVQADIRSLDPDDYPRATGALFAPPCPTFTGAGKQSALKDGNYRMVLDGAVLLGDSQGGLAASDAYEVTYELVSDARTALVLETLKFGLRLPNLQWLVAEQVPAVHAIWEETCAELAASHDWESCNVVTLRASDFGAATRRTRVFLIATRNRTPDLSGLPMRTWWSCGRFASPRVNLPAAGARFRSTSMAQALGWPTGITVNTRGERRTAGGNEFSADGPAVSMTGNGLRAWYRTDLGKPDGWLTPSQAGLLQGFPADYPWQGARSSQLQRIADTVSPLVGAAAIGAAAGVPWVGPVSARLAEIYGDAQSPRMDEQLDLFGTAA
jgi:DNA (cytosine-5)-methyltransferase 1